MAVTTQILQDGPRNCVMKFTNDGDVEAAVLKVDVSTLSYVEATGPCTAVRINAIRYQLIGMNLQILWDATTDVLAVELVPQAGDHICMRQFGGLTNNSGAGKTGDIRFTTIGTPATDASYTIILEMVKIYGHGIA
jgi:hypothetical protein